MQPLSLKVQFKPLPSDHWLSLFRCGLECSVTEILAQTFLTPGKHSRGLQNVHIEGTGHSKLNETGVSGMYIEVRFHSKSIVLTQVA